MSLHHAPDALMCCNDSLCPATLEKEDVGFFLENEPSLMKILARKSREPRVLKVIAYVGPPNGDPRPPTAALCVQLTNCRASTIQSSGTLEEFDRSFLAPFQSTVRIQSESAESEPHSDGEIAA